MSRSGAPDAPIIFNNDGNEPVTTSKRPPRRNSWIAGPRTKGTHVDPIFYRT